jgi:hypothetical protein
MRTIGTRLAVGLLALALTAGCGVETECEITCADGFKITVDDECEDANVFVLAQNHGGSCVAEEHNELCVIPWCD